jgi:hypothetical protein
MKIWELEQILTNFPDQLDICFVIDGASVPFDCVSAEYVPGQERPVINITLLRT